MSQDSNLEDLLKAAAGESTVSFSNAYFDVFLLITGFSMDELTERVYVDDLFYAYSQFYYKKFKKLPHRKKFTIGSNVAKLCYIRRSHPVKKGRLAWGFKCSKLFKGYVTKVKEDATWQKKYKSILNAKKSHKSRKINKKENSQLETLLNMRLSKKDSTPK